MGNSNSDCKNQQLFNSFNRNDWKVLSKTGLYQIWQNTKTNDICQAYKLDYIPEQKNLQQYKFRHDNQKASYFVSIKHVNIVQDKFLCSKGQSYVLTEFIPVKLYDMKNLNIYEGFSLLRSSYCAFNTIQAFHGPFSPQQQLIGVNVEGKPKIWVNKDHSKGSSTTVNKAKVWQKHQFQVSQNVRKILEMIQEKLQAKQFPNQFRSYFYDNVLNFFQAYQFVQQYCQKKQIDIPNQISYMRHIQDQNIYKIIDLYQKNQSIKDLSHISSAKFLPQGNNTESSQKNILSENRFSKVIIQNKVFQKAYPTVQRVSTVSIIPPLNGIIQQNQRRNFNYRVSQVKALSPSPIIISNNGPAVRKSISQVIINNVKIQSPKKITSNNQTIRPLGTKLIYSPTSKQLITIAQSKYCGQLSNKQLISQALAYQKNQLNDQNSSPQNLKRSIHEKFLGNIEQQNSQERTQQKGDLNKYINQQSDNQQINNQERQLISQPDWQNLHQQNNKQQQNHQNFHQYQNQNQALNVQEDQLNSQEQRYHRQYLQDQQGGQLHEQIQTYVQEQFQQSPRKQTIHQLQDKTQTNQAYGQRQQYEFRIESSNHKNSFYEQNVQSSYNNNIYLAQNYRTIQNVQNVQSNYYNYNYNNNYSKQSTELPQQNYQKSSGTLIIHESQQNIYDGVNNNNNNKLSVLQRPQFVQSHGNITQIDQKPYHSKILQMKKLQIDLPHCQIHNHTNSIFPLKYQGLHFRNQSDQFYLYKPSQPIYNQQFIQNIQRNTIPNNDITKLQSQKQIQDYIKDKYSHMFIKFNQSDRQNGQENNNQNVQPRRSSREERTMTFAKEYTGGENLEFNFNRNYAKDYSEVQNYDYNFNKDFVESVSLPRPESKNNYKKQVQKIMGNFESQYYEPVQKLYALVSDDGQKESTKYIVQNQLDFLDVKNLQKNLDKKYKNSDSKSHSKNKSANSTPISQEDGFNIAVLDQKLQKFEESRQNQDKKLYKIEEMNVIQNLQKFSQFDNFVQMMDKKIQQSQSKAKITSSRSGTNKDYPPKPPKDQRNIESTPINYIPVLKRDSKRKNTSDIQLNIKPNYSQDNILSSQRDRQRSQRIQAKQYPNQKQNIQMNNGYTFSKKDIDQVQPQRNINQESKKRVSKRLSAVQDAKKLAQQIQMKYEKHINKTSNFDTNSPQKGSFKKIKDSYNNFEGSINNNDNQMRKYQSNRVIEIDRKRTSRLQPIIQLNGQLSPYKAPTIRNQNLNTSNNQQQHFDSYKTLPSNKNSNQNSRKNIGIKNQKKISKVSYQQLRDLLWN